MSAVPKLRFPEFDGEWSRSRIDEIGTLKSGVGFPEKEQGGFEGTPFYKVSDMNTPENSQEMVLANHYVTEEQIKRLKYKPIASNSIIFAKVGAAIFLDRKRQARNFLLDNNMMAFLPSSEIDFRFIYQVFLQINLAKFAQVGALPSYNASDIGIIKTHTPSLPEQQKIASFLSSVDKKIDLLRQKNDALELYKKGLMQKIFSQEIRFKQDDGSDFPDWEEVYADEIFKTVSNRNHDGTGPIVSISQTGGAVYRDQNGIDIIASEESVKNYKIVEPGDFVISLRSFQGGIEYSEIRGICSPAYTVMKPKVDFDAAFFRSFLKTGNFIRRLSLTVVGIRDGKQISFGAFSTVPLPLPSLPEQQKIASFLSAMDAKIQKASFQIEQMETFKKGLLQQMFV